MGTSRGHRGQQSYFCRTSRSARPFVRPIARQQVTGHAQKHDRNHSAESLTSSNLFSLFVSTFRGGRNSPGGHSTYYSLFYQNLTNLWLFNPRLGEFSCFCSSLRRGFTSRMLTFCNRKVKCTNLPTERLFLCSFHSYIRTTSSIPLGVCCFHYLQLGPETAVRVRPPSAAAYTGRSLVIGGSLFSSSGASGGKYECRASGDHRGVLHCISLLLSVPPPGTSNRGKTASLEAWESPTTATLTIHSGTGREKHLERRRILSLQYKSHFSCHAGFAAASVFAGVKSASLWRNAWFVLSDPPRGKPGGQETKHFSKVIKRVLID